jgi:hypothetical protein
LEPVKRTRSSSARFGSADSEPHPGRKAGSSGPRSLTPLSASHSGRLQPIARATSRPSTTRSSVGTVSISWCHETTSWVSSIGDRPARKLGSSWTYTTSGAAAAWSCSRTGATIVQVGQSRFTIATRPSGSTGTSLIGAPSSRADSPGGSPFGEHQ